MATVRLYQQDGEKEVCSHCGGDLFFIAIRKGAAHPYACVNCLSGKGDRNSIKSSVGRGGR